MPGKYGSGSVTITIDDGQAGTGRVVTANVTSLQGVKITALTQVSTAYGDTIVKQLPTGLKEYADLEIEGWWDTTATTGTHAVFGDPDDDPNAGTRTAAIVFGDSKTWTTECYLKEYEAIATVGQLHRFRARLAQISGAWS